MARANTYLGPLSLVLLAGSLVLLFFVILSGITPTTPLVQTYFLTADTSGITGARDVSQWTYLYICGADNTDCRRAFPDPPVGWAWSADPENAPAELVGSLGDGTTSSYYFYMWRFGWAFYLIATFFTVLTFFAGFVACFGRLGSAIAGFVSLVALFFLTIAAALMTATFVKMRDAFLASGRSASIGVYAFGFTWGAWAALFLATALFWFGVRQGHGDATRKQRIGWGRRGQSVRSRRSVRSRQSYDLGSRRVKEDYA